LADSLGRALQSAVLGAISLASPPTAVKELSQKLSSHVRLPGQVSREDLARHSKALGLSGVWVDAFLRDHGAGQGLQVQGSLHRRDVLREFEQYAERHEASLRHSFVAMDADHDGQLDLQELQAGLAAVVIDCPRTCSVSRACPDSIREICAHVKAAGACRCKGATFDYACFRELYVSLPQGSYPHVDYFAPRASVERCETGGCVVNHDVKHTAASPWGHLVAGAAAGAVSRTATAPLETLRLQAMTGAAGGMGVLAAAKDILVHEGWRGMYRGNLMNVIRAGPQKGLDFMAFDMALDRVTRLGHHLQQRRGRVPPGTAEPGDPTVFQTLLAAGIAGACTNVTLYPLEVVRSRLTVDIAGRYRGILHAAWCVARDEGLRGLYGGLGSSVAAIIPEAAITYGLFDILKRRYQAASGRPDVPVLPAVSFGVVSALCGQLTAFPLEVVSRRLQVRASSAGTVVAKEHLPAALARIAREEGVGALYRGIVPATLRVVPMAIFSFGTYEVVRAAITRLEEKQAEAEALHVVPGALEAPAAPLGPVAPSAGPRGKRDPVCFKEGGTERLRDAAGGSFDWGPSSGCSGVS